MNHHTCTSCDEKIPNGRAVIRSIDFQRVAFHKDCWTLHRATLPALQVA